MDDETIITFGKHKGKKLANVPASWFLWYLDAPGNKKPELMAYIADNMMVLLQEKDLKNVSN